VSVTARPIAAPTSPLATTSTAIASPDPFVPPNGRIVPSRAAAGSVVGSPSASSATPSESGSPAARRCSTVPRAIAAVDISRLNGGLVGSPIAIEFVPKIGSRPPWGGMAGSVFVIPIPT
jgi:hypothetical protein